MGNFWKKRTQKDKRIFFSSLVILVVAGVTFAITHAWFAPAITATIGLSNLLGVTGASASKTRWTIAVMTGLAAFAIAILYAVQGFDRTQVITAVTVASANILILAIRIAFKDQKTQSGG